MNSDQNALQVLHCQGAEVFILDSHHQQKRDWEHQTHFVFAVKRPLHYLLNFREFNWSNQENPGKQLF